VASTSALLNSIVTRCILVRDSIAHSAVPDDIKKAPVVTGI
jgi:hypothetical protein